VLRVILTTDGEVVTREVPDVGYLHRGLEKIGERVNHAQFMPFTDRLDYLAAMNCNCAWAWAVEKLAKIEVPEPRRIPARHRRELKPDLLAPDRVRGRTPRTWGRPPVLYAIRQREKVKRLFEMICGNRLTYNYARVGASRATRRPGFLEKTKEVPRLLRAEARRVQQSHLLQQDLRPPAGERRRHPREEASPTA